MNTKKFPRVSTYQLALGNEKSKRLLNVNEHSHSSSFLHTSDAHDLAFPDTKEIGEEEVNVEKLSNLIGEICLESPSLLKLDVQGFEMSVVAGAEAALDKIDYVILEASFREMYRGEKLFLQTVEEMRAYGFRFLRPVGFLKDPQTLEILQIDALFVRGS